ncbi:hypothetical protein DL771_000434 [Monosporascus sp. 5C6A]|nr:hypothetical protein DL771_000434 [Monosporascus sp. 5C6A]
MDDSYPINCFLGFACDWAGSFSKASCFDDPQDPGRSVFRVRHVVRLFESKVVNNNHEEPEEENYDRGLALHRVAGWFPSLGGRSNIAFAEKRVSLLLLWSAMKNEYRELPVFKVVILNDVGYSYESLDWPLDHGLTISGRAAGFQFLQLTIYKVLKFWADEWTQCLENLDETAEEILDEDTMQNLMFDGSFQRSKLYFETLQILRIFADNIRFTGNDLEDIGHHFTGPPKYIAEYLLQLPYAGPYATIVAQEVEALQANWNIVTKFHHETEQRLLQRIEEKAEEVKSLRDGLLNATSLLEASQSTKMSRYIIAFTVVTIAYLPPSFVATAFGTQLFNDRDNAVTITKYKWIL